jgi:lipoprotein-anchoring transpeptidase ErfK/SrfK
LAHAERVVISVDKISQKMTVSIDGQREYVWPISTAAAGYTTPSGTFHPFRMEEDHFSDEWDDAPMPYSIFFTPAGHAIHGSEHVKSLGRPASHGCVRLDPANAAILYTLVEEAGMANTIVVVKGGLIKRVSRERESASLYGVSERARFRPGALY